MEILGKILRQLRQSKNLTQQELANLLGVSKATISEYERGKSNPSPSRLIRIANIFNVSIDYFYGKTLRLSRENYLVALRGPVIDKIPANIQDSTQLNILSYHPLDENLSATYQKYFIFKCNDTFHLIHIQGTAESGDTILACAYGQDAIFFDCIIESEKLILVSQENQKYELDDNIKIVGKLVK